MNSSRNSGISTIEMVILIAVVGLISAIGAATMNSGLLSGSKQAKLSQDVGVLNSAVSSYLAFGGDLSETKDQNDVLAKLKSSLSEEKRKHMPGMTGSFIDPSVEFVLQSEEEAASDQPRLHWNHGEKKFVLAYGGAPGIKQLRLNPFSSPSSDKPATEDRETSFTYAKNSNWIWDYEEAAPTNLPGPSSFPTGVAIPTPATPSVPAPSTKRNLDSPLFSIPGGTHPAQNFDLSLSLSDPNPSGTAQIFYSQNYGGWSFYTPGSTISVSPETSIKAQSIPTDPANWNASPVVNEIYHSIRITLLPPQIEFSHAQFSTQKDNPVDTINVVLSDQNEDGLATIQYQLVPVPGGSGPTTSFQNYSGDFDVSSSDYPEGFGVRAYAAAVKRGYDDSRVAARFATEVEGLFGGHLDLDTSTEIARIARGSTNAHTHDITGKFDIRTIDFFAIPESKQIEISEAISDPSQRFKITVVNGNLSPGLSLVMDYESGGKQYSVDMPVNAYDDTGIDELTIFTLGGNNNTAKLNGLRITMTQDVIHQAGVIPTNTGDVKSNILGKNSEWRNGSLTVQALAVSPAGTDAFTTNSSLSNGDHGAAQSGMLWEAAMFWHWDGDSYHEEDNHFTPNEFSSIEDEVDD